MKALLIRQFGGIDTLKIEDVPDPKPGPGDVLVRIKAAGVNSKDIWARSGPPGGKAPFPWKPRPFPYITGGDGAGVVEEVGEGVEGFRPGDRVGINPILYCGRCAYCLAGEQSLCFDYKIFGDHRPGAFAELTTIPQQNLIALPDHVSFEDAAVLPACYTTAWRGLMTAGQLQAGQDLLVVGASGGVGTAALVLGNYAGARVFALVGDAEKARKAEALGAIPIDRSAHPKFSERVLALTDGLGVHVASDPVGAATWPETIRSLRRLGKMVICGASGGERPDFDIREVYQRHRQILGAPMGNLRDFHAVMSLLFQNRIRPIIHTVMPLAEVREAHRMFEAREHFGKIVLVP